MRPGVISQAFRPYLTSSKLGTDLQVRVQVLGLRQGVQSAITAVHSKLALWFDWGLLQDRPHCCYLQGTLL